MAELADLEYVASALGAVVSLAQKSAMQSSLQLLKKSHRFAAVKLFGKIQGNAADYLVAVGAGDGLKKYFFSLDGVTWAPLPEVTAEVKVLCAKLPGGLAFTGDAAHTITLDAPPEESEEPGEPPTVTEDVRLAVMVCAIEAECALAPVGALAQNPVGGPLVPNAHYGGLNHAAALSLSSYVIVNCQKPSSFLQEARPANPLDALASAESVTPPGSLCTRLDEATGAVQVRSLLWPGHVAYVLPGTPTHGYCYFGGAIKNVDIAFMLP